MTGQLQPAKFPEASWKVYTTVDTPTGNKSPELKLLLAMLAVPDISVAVGVTQVTVVPGVPRETVTVTPSVQMGTGAVVSTVIMNKKWGIITRVIVIMTVLPKVL